MSILVIGSFMMDLVVRTPRAPQNGETIVGDSFSRFLGGKGANQAVSIARLNKDVIMAGKLGSDLFGDEAIETLKKESINTNYILRDCKNPTGVGAVTLEENGDNRIIIVPGANLFFDIEDLNNIRNVIQRSKLLVLQLEMDLRMIEKAISYAYEDQIPVILNPAPAQDLSDSLLSKVTYLTPNETEAELLTGIKLRTISDAERAGQALLDKGVENVIITLGEQGALVVNQSITQHLPSLSVTPYDTVAAGDAFNGALAAGIRDNQPLIKVVEYANAVGALTVTRHGSIPSLPYVHEVEAFINDN